MWQSAQSPVGRRTCATNHAPAGASAKVVRKVRRPAPLRSVDVARRIRINDRERNVRVRGIRNGVDVRMHGMRLDHRDGTVARACARRLPHDRRRRRPARLLRPRDRPPCRRARPVDEAGRAGAGHGVRARRDPHGAGVPRARRDVVDARRGMGLRTRRRLRTTSASTSPTTCSSAATRTTSTTRRSRRSSTRPAFRRKT